MRHALGPAPVARLAYTRYDQYRSRSEPPSYMAGARIAHFGRVEWHIIPDASTAAAVCVG